MALPPKDKPTSNQRPIRQPDGRPRQARVHLGSTHSSSGSPLVKALLIIGVAAALVVTLLLGYAFLIAKPNLPKISALTDYKPKTPLRIYTADKVLIGEFGEERRKVIPLNEIPLSMRNAVIATEDDRF
jgi:penicillin-binding protein 1A